MESGITPSDVMAMTRQDGFLEGNGIIILILFFLIFGFNGNWGNNGQQIATPTQVYDATNQQSVFNSLNGIKEAVNTGIYENARTECQNTAALTMTMNNGFNDISSQLNNLGYQMSQCCCDLKTQLLQDKYDDTRYQLEQANTAVANAVQTQNILNHLGRYYTYPALNPQYAYGYGTTIA